MSCVSVVASQGKRSPYAFATTDRHSPRRADGTHDSKSGHAEAIRVTCDPSIISYEDT
jgi:peptide methionine sulfoxide reductase MsrA